MADTVEEIKEKLNAVDVVGSYVKLTRAGKYWKGLCPFHSEKTPSFMVSPERGFYHCFGCGKGGDIFSFVQDIENLDFKGALILLAQKAGVQIEYERKEASDEKEKLFSVLKDAEKFYHDTLRAKHDANEYLAKRGLKPETVEQFNVGYAPNEWRALSEHLVGVGHAVSIIEEAGLAKRPESHESLVISHKQSGDAGLVTRDSGAKRPYDRFRGRIMFPIRDISGRVVGFSGRIFEDDPKHPQAKYINSPETAVFHKSRILFGFDKAKEGIRKYGFALLVEGQVDLLMAHQVGFTNAVALSGTSFTDAHAALIRRHTENLLIAFDGDTAGIAAAGRAAALALKAGLNTKIALMEEGSDPADVIRENPEAFKKAVREARHVIDFYLMRLAEEARDERSFRLAASRTVLPFLPLIHNAIDREHFISRIAERLGVAHEAVREELQKMGKVGKQVDNDHGVGVDALLTRGEERFLSRKDTIERLLVGFFLLYKEREDEAMYAALRETLLKSIGAPHLERLIENQEYTRAAIIDADVYLADSTDAAAEHALVTDLIKDFEREVKRKQYREKTNELKRLEATGSDELTKALLEEIAALARDI